MVEVRVVLQTPSSRPQRHLKNEKEKRKKNGLFRCYFDREHRADGEGKVKRK